LIYYGGSVRWKWIYLRWNRNDYSTNGWKTLRVLASIYKSNWPSNGQIDKSVLG
jgi:hypothetical protein